MLMDELDLIALLAQEWVRVADSNDPWDHGYKCALETIADELDLTARLINALPELWRSAFDREPGWTKAK